MRHEKDVEIRWADLDGFGHVSHRAMLGLLEEARDEWVLAVLGVAALERLFIRRIEVDYLSQMTQADDYARIAIETGRVGTTSVTTVEEARSALDGRLVARSSCVMVHMADDMVSTAPLPAALRARLEAPAQDR